MRSWISNPQAIKPGVLMPAFQTLGATEIGALADYLDADTAEIIPIHGGPGVRKLP